MPREKRPWHRGLSHVIYRLKPGMPSLRRPRVLRALEGAFRAGKTKGEFRLVAYSLQHTHIHMIVEGPDAAAISRGMQGLGVRLTKQLNRLWDRRGKGSVFRERFKQVVLKAAHVFSAMRYVLNNALKHRSKRDDGLPDRYSSAPWYRWIREPFRRPLRRAPVAPSRYVEAVCCGAIVWVGLREVPGAAGLYY